MIAHVRGKVPVSQRATSSKPHLLQRLGLWIFVLSIPLQGQGWEAGITVNLALLGGVFFVLTHLRLLTRHRFRTSDRLFLAFLWVAALSIVINALCPQPLTMTFSEELRWGMARSLVHLLRFVLLYAVYACARSALEVYSTGLSRFFRAFRVMVLLVFIYGSYQLIGGFFDWPFLSLNNLHDAGFVYRTRFFDSGTVRVFATFWEPKHYGQFLIGAILLLTGHYIVRRQTSRSQELRLIGPPPSLGQIILVLGLLFHLVMSFSRASLIAFVVVAGFLLTSQRRVRVYSLRITAGFLVAFLLSFQFLLKVPVASGFQVLLRSYLAPRGTISFNLQRSLVALEAVRSRPVLGYGLGGLVFASEDLQGRLPPWARTELFNAPDIFSYLLSGCGIAGTLLFLLFVASILIRAWRALRILDASSRTFEASFLVFVFSGVVGVWMQFATLASWNEVYVFLLLAVLDALTTRLLGPHTESRIVGGRRSKPMVTVRGSRPA